MRNPRFVEAASEVPESIAFGRFRVLPHRRELLVDGQAAKLGGRAFDVLLALIETPGAVLSKDALMARVWPDRVVEENNLQAQISALRAAFGPERDLIRTVPGRGYQFAGRIQDPPAAAEARADTQPVASGPGRGGPPTNLPAPVSELIGRDGEIAEILNFATAHRLVTLTGPGGIGKTRLALAIARELLPHFPDGVWLAEFSALADPGLVPATVAAAVGLDLGGGEASAQRVTHALAGRRLLLVLDNCEHVIDAAAEIAEAVVHAGSAVHIVATSREPLRAEGEWIYTVPPLEVPAEHAQADDDPLQYGAVLLFLQRARAAEPHFPADGRAAALTAAICRRLDGMPLAIELAAARAVALGIDELTARLDHRFHLLTGGRRTGLPRHQTLRATLDWSYELLAERERVILRRLGIFAGYFSLVAASAVVASDELKPSEVVDGLSSLVAKSLVATGAEGNPVRYRLLETTRAYALEKLIDSGEHEAVARRQAEYYSDLFAPAEADSETRSQTEWLTLYGGHIDNVRASLDWAFSPSGDRRTGVALTIAAVPLWVQLSLLDECRERVERALQALDAGDDPTIARQRMRLTAALAAALFHTKGAVPEVAAGWEEALALAQRLEEPEYQLRALWGLWSYSIGAGDYPGADRLGRRFREIAERSNHTGDLLIAERMIGGALHFLGDQPAARRHIEAMLHQYDEALHRPHIVRFHYDQGLAARVTLARILWAQGFPEQASRAAATAVEEAEAARHPISLCFALNEAANPVALFAGEWAKAERYTATLLRESERHALSMFHARAIGATGVLAAKRGDARNGAELIRAALSELDKSGYHAYPLLLGSLAEALREIGDIEEGLSSVESALSRCERNGERWYIADLLRIKGELTLGLPDPEAAIRAEREFLSSLDWARRQGALSWELRAATSLAKLRVEQNRPEEARRFLGPVYNRFTEGFDTADLRVAKSILDGLTQRRR